MSDVDILVPSYHRSDNLKTLRYFCGIGWEPSKIHILIDDEAGDEDKYREVCESYGCRLEVLNIAEQRRRFDYVHREPKSRRAAGMMRNAFCEYAEREGIDFYLVMDDDTASFQMKLCGKYQKVKITKEIICYVLSEIRAMMEARGIGAFALPQTGDFIGGTNSGYLYRPKMMNFVCYRTGYIRRGERGAQDNDTSMFCGILNEGLFCGTFADGLVLSQTSSGTSSGGLTDLYHEQKLLNKALVVPIQFPSAVYGERQVMNGGRLHHHIDYRYLMPKILKGTPERDNIDWKKWPEDWPFTNEKIVKEYGE